MFPKESVLLIGLILEGSPVADKLRELALEIVDIFDTQVEVPTVTTPVTVINNMINNTSMGAIAVPNTKIPTMVVGTTPQKEHNNMSVSVVNTTNDFTIDSRDVAEMVGKEHKNVMRDIATIINHLGGQLKIEQSYFIESEYTNSQNKKQPCYKLTKKGCELFATRMTGAKGTQFAVAYIEKFNQMEEQLKAPAIPMASYMIDNLIERAKLWIKEEEQRMLLVETVETQTKLIEHKEEVIEKQIEVIGINWRFLFLIKYKVIMLLLTHFL